MAVDDDSQEVVRQLAVGKLAESMLALRGRDALSLHGLADRTSIERKVLRGLEAGALNPSLKTLDRVAAAFGVSVAQLFGGRTEASGCILGSPALIAINVKRLRHSRHWSTADLESRIRMKAAYVSFIETGRAGCTLQTLARLAAGFDVDIAELLSPPVRLAPQDSRTRRVSSIPRKSRIDPPANPTRE